MVALRTWLAAADLHDGPVFRKVSTGNRVLDRALHPESVNNLVRAAVARAGLADPETYGWYAETTSAVQLPPVWPLGAGPTMEPTAPEAFECPNDPDPAAG